MFGMSSTDFWENDPQLYWAYRTFYLKKQEYEQENIKYTAWLNGNMQSIGTLVALSKGFNKNSRAEYPQYNEIFTSNDKKGKLTQNDKNRIVQETFNSWAR